MDACDELGIFMIVATRVGSFGTGAPQFQEYVLDDVTQMIRRGRNHPSVLLWEPILNETRFPLDFSMKAWKLHKRISLSGAPLAAADMHSKALLNITEWCTVGLRTKERPNNAFSPVEFGENVDDWYAQNNNNRASRIGENCPSWFRPCPWRFLRRNVHYQRSIYRRSPMARFRSPEGLSPRSLQIGQTDCFRQPKYAYYMFKSQVSRSETSAHRNGPMVFIAHEISLLFRMPIWWYSAAQLIPCV